MPQTQAAKPNWITGPAPAPAEDYAALYLRGAQKFTRKVRSARARVSALGWYRFFVNGADQTGTALVPRWTPFDQYVEYQDYDITDALREGDNTFAIAIGDGRFRGRIGGSSRQAVYGDRLAGNVTIDVEYTDGSRAAFVSDETWWAGTGRIGTTDPMNGEHVDLRIPEDDWLNATDTPGRFAPAEILDTERVLIAEDVARVQQIDTLAPVALTRTPSGQQLVDFGQNAVGVIRLRLAGPEGTVVRLTHSEIITTDGEVDVEYLAIPPVLKPLHQTDQVILDGTQTWWQPWFTIHGFRYVQIEGLPIALTADDIEFVVLSTQLEETGSFETSDARLNKLYENVRWSLRSNFTDTPPTAPPGNAPAGPATSRCSPRRQRPTPTSPAFCAATSATSPPNSFRTDAFRASSRPKVQHFPAACPNPLPRFPAPQDGGTQACNCRGCSTSTTGTPRP